MIAWIVVQQDLLTKVKIPRQMNANDCWALAVPLTEVVHKGSFVKAPGQGRPTQSRSKGAYRAVGAFGLTMVIGKVSGPSDGKKSANNLYRKKVLH